MLSLEKIFQNQIKMYPKMEMIDAIKLIYQNEFGGEHLVINRAESLKRPEHEISCSGTLANLKVLEDIGNNKYRYYINSTENRLSIETLNNIFVYSSEMGTGTIDGFDSKMNFLVEQSRCGLLPFSEREIKEFSEIYYVKNGKYPPVSHSENYRNVYAPHYRILDSFAVKYMEIFRKIDKIFKKEESILVGIDGNSGAGKSSLSKLLQTIYPDSNVFHMDDFFLPNTMKTTERLKQAGGNVHYERFKDEVLQPLLSKSKSFTYDIYDCQSGNTKESELVQPRKLNIMEGVYSQHNHLNQPYNLTIFLSIDEEKQKKRILERNGEFMLKRFLDEWIPLENEYFERMNILNNSIIHIQE